MLDARTMVIRDTIETRCRTIAVVVAALIALGRIAAVLVNYLWFASIGYSQCFGGFPPSRPPVVGAFAASAGACCSGRVARGLANSLGARPSGAAISEVSRQPLPI